ncbi:hypothetical protein CHLRE_09g390603v5 [Chlamydomonas reinhardtii]|uniref:Uncharacterized protein n=1 Tax=Chlamydomonas reinhardtii TaxID=3055 RepID=A0A2K3DDJ5_CHLRE|nr:uncharacterized protein CHLRE_09g390603v5 [Chlamydomonas reinhardtii]PNW78596.1 hypothetical protein CHLRE_09g390603v5 [Chlamydomonas reinhardtii]
MLQRPQLLRRPQRRAGAAQPGLTALTASCTSPLHASGSTRAAFQDSPPPSTGSTTTSCITGPLITITDGSYHNTHNHHIICRGAGPGAGRCTVPASALARWPGQRGSRGRCCVLARVRRRWRQRWWLTGTGHKGRGDGGDAYNGCPVGDSTECARVTPCP